MIDVEGLLRSVCELMSPRAHEKRLEIGWAVGRGLAPILADEGRLRQILLNFVGNAVKFVERGGVLLVAEPLGAGRVRFTVSDTGPGVAGGGAREDLRGLQSDRSGGGREPGRGGSRPGYRPADRRGHGRPGGNRAGRRRRGRLLVRGHLRLRGAGLEAQPLKGHTVAIASPSAIVRAAATRQIEAAGGRALSGAGIAEVLERCGEAAVSSSSTTRWRAASLPFGRRPAVPASFCFGPMNGAAFAAIAKRGFAGYLIKPLRPSSLAARVLAAAGVGPAAAPVDDERIKDAKSAPGAPDPAMGARVLLAEDNPVNAMLARTLLRREGCRVDQVADGAAVLTALAGQDYDLVLMDVRMPVLDGVGATEALRSRGFKVPVVALTANDFDDDRRMCTAAGMNDFLVKPVSAEALREVLGRWTAGVPAARLSA